MMSMDNGRIDKIVSSKSRVKSRPPRHPWAYGPNELSIVAHVNDREFIVSSFAYPKDSGK
jgi:hypothetical protein